MNIQQILIKYWGHSSFREKQEEIIESVLQGKDTLALLPTGGGKSICFQIPAMAKEGICIVVSPLIALMRDQVDNLSNKDIPALMVSSGMSRREIDITLDNAVYGKYKFLYLSPERLQTELFVERAKKMNVNLIAVDEAHCISQWGYDFRPSYLQIASLREILPKVPVIALTATATSKVIVDIQSKLLFKKLHLIQKSFERKNLAYVVQKVEDNMSKMLKILQGVSGTSIIYVSSRRRTVEIAKFLRQNEISADYYHAGVPHLDRNLKQQAWVSNKSRVIVATSAFGMGIDKPNVRSVIHLDLPDSLEAYFQEAGRAGRDGKKAYAVLLLRPNMLLELQQRVEREYPPIKSIKKVYTSICNFFQIPHGGGLDQSFDLPIKEIAERYNIDKQEFYYSCKILEKEGMIALSEAFFIPSRLHILLSNEDLYKFQVSHPKYDVFIKTLLRSYAGVFDNYVKINEKNLANRMKLGVTQLKTILKRLEELQVLSYREQSNLAQIDFTQPRWVESDIRISQQNYQERKKRAIEKMKAVMHYAESEHICRSQILLEYFGEKDRHRCGMCDVCLEMNKMELSEMEFKKIEEGIHQSLKSEAKSMNELVDELNSFRPDSISKVLDFMLDREDVETDGICFFIKK